MIDGCIMIIVLSALQASVAVNYFLSVSPDDCDVKFDDNFTSGY